MEEFDDETKQLLRDLAKDRDRRRWLADLVKRGAQWIVAVSLAVTVLLDWISRAIKHFGER